MRVLLEPGHPIMPDGGSRDPELRGDLVVGQAVLVLGENKVVEALADGESERFRAFCPGHSLYTFILAWR